MKYRQYKKLLCAVLASSMVVTGVPVSSTYADEVQKLEIAEASENDKTDTQTGNAKQESKTEVEMELDFSKDTDKVIADKSGKGNNATIKGKDVNVKDGALNLTSGGYVELPMSLMDGLEDQEAFTIETKFKRAKNCGANAWLYCIGSKAENPGKNYMFLSPVFGGSTFRSGIKDASNEQLFDTSLTSSADKEYTVAMVFDHGKVTLYVDGIQIGKTIDSGYKIKDIINDGCKDGVLGFLGKSCWSPDPNFTGTVTSFRIFDGVLEAEDIQSEFKESFQQDFEKNLVVDDILNRNKAADEIMYDLTLPDTVGATKVSWESDNTDVISAKGEVRNDADEDKEVTLRASIRSGALEAVQEFKLVVKKLDKTELNKLVDEAKEIIESGRCAEGSRSRLEKAITKADEAATQSEVRIAAKELKEVIQKADDNSLYEDPFELIPDDVLAPETELRVGNREVLMTIPEAIRGYVDVECRNSNEAAVKVEYKDGVVTASALESGIADITVVVTAKSDGFVMEYETFATVKEVEKDKNEQYLVAGFSFDNEENGFVSGDYKAVGEYEALENGTDGTAVKMKGSNSQYLTIKDSEGKSPLTGLDEFTLSYDLKPANDDTSWSVFTTPNVNGRQEYQYERYIGVITGNGKSCVQRFDNNGARSEEISLATPVNKWSHIDIVFEKSGTKLYVDKTKYEEVNSEADIKTLLGEDSVLWLGHANWGDGETFNGSIDNFRIYNKALSTDELGAKVKKKEKSKAEDLTRKVDVKVTKVDADVEDSINVEIGEDRSLNTTAKVTFSDGRTKDNAVIVWTDENGNTVSNTNALGAGHHKLTGKVSYFGNPIIDEKADPYVIYNKDDGYYYFTSSWPAYYDKDHGYDRIALRRAKTLEGLADAEDHVIWWHHTDGTAPKYHIWAPELHKVGDKWVVYFAASASATNQWDIHPYVITCDDPSDLLNEDKWSDAVRFTNADGTVADNFDNFDLDMTTFNYQGTDYVIWAHKPDASYLKMGVLDSEEPWHLKEGTDTIILTTPEYSWEMNGGQKINEGPAVIQTGDKIFVTFSGSTTGPEYCMGLMMADQGSDIMDIKNWTKSTKPILKSSDLYQQYGPGHNSFTKDEFGNDVIVYHARDEECYQDKCEWANRDPLYDPCRNAYLAYVRWSDDGIPVLSNTEYKETKDIPDFEMTVNIGSEEDIAKTDAQAIKINGLDDVRGNITLPLTGEKGSVIEWTSSKPEVITDKETDGKKAGVVTRQDEDTQVILTAAVKFGDAVEYAKFAVNVKAKAEIKDTTHYLFAHFTGNEQIYFSDSKDGLNWKALNDGEPTISSTLGEKGLRDPFIMRSPEGDKFYLIATDLRIASDGNWTRAQTAGSKSIMVWESTDLVNWGEQRMVEVARDDAGCTWAPEAVYNEETGEYMVFWASKVDDDNYTTQKIYYATTRDFYTFSEPEVWIELYNKDGKPISIIDTSVIAVEENGKTVYYRLSKNEADRDATVVDGDPANGKFEILEKSDSLLGEWTRVSSKYLNTTQHVEGGTIFKFNGENKWCMLLDNYGNGGYFPSVTNDIGSGEFTRLNDNEYSFPSTMRHGTVIPITTEEYNALEAKWGKSEAEKDIDTSVSLKNSALFNLSFDGEDTIMADGVSVTAANGYKLVDNELLGGKAIELSSDEKQWLNIKNEDKKALLAGKKEIAINYWSKVTDKSSANKGWAFFAAPNADAINWGASGKKETYLGVIDATKDAAISDKGLTVQRFNDPFSRPAVNNTKNVGNEWKMVTVVATENYTTLYVNGEKVSQVKSSYALDEIFGDSDNGMLQIGKANWGGGEYFNGQLDDITVYGRAITSEEVAAIYSSKSYTGKEEVPEEPTEEPTEEPSTEEPSTEAPSTEAPSTEAPSTEAPSTEAPSTEEPSTEAPSTEEPSTEAPSTEAPSTEEPSTEEPSTEAPSTEEPSTEATSTEEPSTEAPSTEEPSTEEPSTEEQPTEAPAPETPSEDKVPSKDEVSKNDAPKTATDKVLTPGSGEWLLLPKTSYYLNAGFAVKKYKVSNKKVLSVSKKGKVKVKKAGNVTVTALGKNGETAVFNIVAEKPKMRKLTVKPVGTFKVNELFTGTSFAEITSVKSSNTKVAEVTADGTVTAKAKGRTKIMVEIGGRKYKGTLIVK